MRFWKPTTLCLVLLLFSTVASAKILFDSYRNGVWGIYIMDDDGSNVTLLTNTLRPRAPAWSPDGKKIVFKRRLRNEFGATALFLMNADGTNIWQLTAPQEKSGRDTNHTFSPDGKYIMYLRRERIDNREKFSINVLNLETGNIKKIGDFPLASLDWAPNGKHVVYATALNLDSSGNSICVMRPDGTGVREIISPPPIGAWLNIARWSPKWSPDGKHILYTQEEYTWEERKPNVRSIIRKAFRYIICDRNGKTVRQLNIPRDLDPGIVDWMDDGKSIVISASKYKLNEPPPDWNRTPPTNIYTYRIETGKLTKLTHSAFPLQDNGFPDWISDQVLSVDPVDKQPIQWSELK